VISAGASTTYQLPAQIGYGGFQFPGVTGFSTTTISALSSSGFEQDGSTISLVAPASSTGRLCSKDIKKYSECTDLAGQPAPVEETEGRASRAP